MSRKILVVDDEPSISTLLEFNLKHAGYDVHCVFDGEAVFPAVQTYRPDAIILDVMLPKMNGFEVCRSLRKQNNQVPIIMLTALQELSSKITGLDIGADDYMTKPFSAKELISRLQAVLRRSEAAQAWPGADETLTAGSIVVKPDRREVFVNGRAVELTPKEYELLLYMIRHKGKVLSRKQLLTCVWDVHFFGDTRIVDVHISHLREKIEDHARTPQYILTVRNVGYKLNDSPDA